MVSDNGKYALALARQRYEVIPCCWTSGPQCGCPRRHRSEKEIGKAPLTPHGVKDATKDPRRIVRYWQQWPLANVAIRLGPDFIMLDPDSDEARKECYANGVPETLTRYSRNKAFIFAAPPGLGNVLFTHKGDSGAIDFVTGYCLAFGTHRTGARIFLENPTCQPAPAPEWMLEWIERFRREAPTPMKFATDDPPVRLSEGGLEWWHGGRVITGANGETDRSATLFQIGIALARGNAGGQVIAAALAERDEALCFDKYSGRNDASVRYTEIAQRVIAVRSQTGRSPVAVAFTEASNA